MDLLLDTSAFIWWDADDPLLGGEARAAIENPKNRVFVSAASVWEIAIKSAKGKLAFAGSATKAIGRNGFAPLLIGPDHAEVAGTLDWAHPDPFDRMLVAQAQIEGLTLVHGDEVIAAFKRVPQLWAK